MNERLWHYAQNNQACGPVPESQLQHMFATGALPRQSYVWTPGMAEWAVAANLEAFQERPAPAPAPAPAPVPVAAAQVQPQASPISPSELVLFNGEQFGTKAMLPVHNVELPHTDVKVNGADVAKAMLAAAILACEQAGAVRLTLQPRKAMMGLRTEMDLQVEPVPGAANPFPQGSFEWGTLSLVGSHGPLKVSAIVGALLIKDTADPDRQCIDVAKEMLHQRGLLTKEQVKAALLFTVNKYHMAPQTPALLQQYGVDPVRQLLDSARTGRPDLWTALTNEINAGRVYRTTSND